MWSLQKMYFIHGAIVPENPIDLHVALDTFVAFGWLLTIGFRHTFGGRPRKHFSNSDERHQVGLGKSSTQTPQPSSTKSTCLGTFVCHCACTNPGLIGYPVDLFCGEEIFWIKNMFVMMQGHDEYRQVFLLVKVVVHIFQIIKMMTPKLATRFWVNHQMGGNQKEKNHGVLHHDVAHCFLLWNLQKHNKVKPIKLYGFNEQQTQTKFPTAFTNTLPIHCKQTMSNHENRERATRIESVLVVRSLTLRSPRSAEAF